MPNYKARLAVTFIASHIQTSAYGCGDDALPIQQERASFGRARGQGTQIIRICARNAAKRRCSGLRQIGGFARWHWPLPVTQCRQDSVLPLRGTAGSSAPGELACWTVCSELGLAVSVDPGCYVPFMGVIRCRR